MELGKYLEQKFPHLRQDITKVVTYFKPVKLKKKALFLEEDAYCKQIAFIESGVMRNYKVHDDGQEITQYMTSDGDFNTVYHAFLDQKRSDEIIQAVTDCTLMVIDRQDFMAFKSAFPPFRMMVDQLVLEGLDCKQQRIYSYRTDDAKRRYENLLERQPKVVQFTPLQHIASYLGITRETLSRIRNKGTSTR